MTVTLIESTLASALVLFFWGAVVYAGLLRNFFPRHFAAIARPKEDSRLWAVAVEKVLQGLVFALLYQHWMHGSASPWLAGLGFGCILGVLMEVTYFFGTWTSFNVKARSVAVPAALGFGRYAAVGLVLGLLHG